MPEIPSSSLGIHFFKCLHWGIQYSDHRASTMCTHNSPKENWLPCCRPVWQRQGSCQYLRNFFFNFMSPFFLVFKYRHLKERTNNCHKLRAPSKVLLTLSHYLLVSCLTCLTGPRTCDCQYLCGSSRVSARAVKKPPPKTTSDDSGL